MTSLLESISTALSSLSANKMRSGLTMLGIIIGVAAVISLMSIGNGAQQQIDQQIESMGTNLLFVEPGSAQVNGVAQAAGSVQDLTYQDAQALLNAQADPAIKDVAPQVQAFGQIVYRANNANAPVIGVTPDYEQVRNQAVQEGSFISPANLNARASVAVLGATIAQELFAGVNPIGQQIRINNVPYQVIGVLVAKGGTGFGSPDDQVLIPITTAFERLQRNRFQGGDVVSLISVEATSASQISAATQEITTVLRQRHHIRYNNDFSILSEQDLLATANQISGVLTVFLAGIAAISLLVGGIGIMNIMLVSVSERTREIGIRKAVGAAQPDILAQFLTEATILSVGGGIIGILAGAGIARLVSGINLGGAALHAIVSPGSVILATVFAVAVGLFFGIYPAYRASKLDPIEALRYE